MNLTELKDFVDLGGIFILSVLLIYLLDKKLSKINDNLTRALALLTMLVGRGAQYNDVHKVLGPSATKVQEIIAQANNKSKDTEKKE